MALLGSAASNPATQGMGINPYGFNGGTAPDVSGGSSSSPVSGLISGAAGGAGLGPYGALIGGGLGLLGSLFGNQPQQSTTTGENQQFLQQYRNVALQNQNNPAFAAAMSNLQAVSGQNPAGASAAMNPYMSAMNPLFAMLRQQAVTGANQQATQMGAFGGTGSQISGDIAGNLADQNQAAFNYQGFQQAMQNLLAASSGFMGLPGAQTGLLTPGLQSGGQTTTIPTQTNPFMGLLGGALAGAGATSPGGMFGKGFGS
jgi:hypothetical protein